MHVHVPRHPAHDHVRHTLVRARRSFQPVVEDASRLVASRSRVISEAWRAAVLAKAMDSHFHTTLVLVYCLRISMQR